MKQEFKISGMSCQHCVKAVQSALAALDQSTVTEVSIGSATIELDAGADPEAVQSAAMAAIDEEGYAVVSTRTFAAVDEG